MPQFLADIKETEFFIEGDEAHHLLEVARKAPGDEIRVFDGKGRQYTARVDRVQKRFARGVLLAALDAPKPALSLELCFAPTSRNTMEDILDKCTQLGVSSFQPILTARCEFDLYKRWETKSERWNQIMLGACKQCDTPYVPVLREPAKFMHLLEEGQPALLTYEAEKTHTLAWGLNELKNPSSLRVYVGPAGGWAEEEVAAARRNVQIVTLGANTLRAETACIAACAKLL